MKSAFLTVGFILWLAIALAGPAASFGLGSLGSGMDKLGASAGTGTGIAPVNACTNGNLLLVYSDPCQLMSQMAGN